MSRLPLVGVTTSVTVDRYPERAYLNSAYVRAVELAGGAPVLLPPPLGADARDALWARLDGLVLTGGGDVDPRHFGEPRHPAVAEVSEARDALELELTRRALAQGLPLLAICRGIQVLNVALGGSLHQDIPSEPGSPLAHSQTERRHQPTHHVKVREGSRLAAILGTHEVDVNSFHHQALARLGRGLAAVAWAPDGIVEGVEETAGGDRFVVGVQWHPEDLVEHDPAARRLFAAFVTAAGARG
ncbi:MAG: gamma-glutamyl-gamma-aminobutyrate hydrolase family protein [Candidatus Rokubacteria bacterium]|nr:gamma-glutamyl-gamma-aminobutyrate hydrolase family protein [Candidatus Rokubacteria bacterium]